MNAPSFGVYYFKFMQLQLFAYTPLTLAPNQDFLKFRTPSAKYLKIAPLFKKKSAHGPVQGSTAMHKHRNLSIEGKEMKQDMSKK